jgi:hypothetical protein
MFKAKLAILTLVAVVAASGIVFELLHKTTPVIVDKPVATDVEVKPPEVSRVVASQDVEVKNATAAMTARVDEYISNHNGKLPLLSSEIAQINDEENKSRSPRDPINGKAFMLVQTAPQDNEILYLVGRKCNADNTIAAADSPRTFVLQSKLVSGALYCVDG